MKKIFTLLFVSLSTLAAMAQTGYAFTDEAGNEYQTSEITCTEVMDDGFGGLQIPSHLYIKNISGEEGTQVAVQANITKIDNGIVQLCFPVNCVSYSSTGEQEETAKGTIPQGSVKDMQTEWLPEAYGECTVTYTAKVYSGIAKKGEFSITVNYKYSESSGISKIERSPITADSRYDLLGRKTNHGLSIVRQANGTVKKVVK